MRRVRLGETDLETSVLGFGCAPLMGRLGRRESLRRIEVAHEMGVTHFDTARSYGYGEAESVLGDFLSTRRASVTVTTKLGIAAARPSRTRTFAKNVFRRTFGRSDRLRAVAGRQAATGVTPGHFGVDEARASLDASLRELRTDHVDLLLLHEFRQHDVRDDLLEFLEQTVREGKARHFGIGTDIDSTVSILRSAPAYAPFVQIANSVLERNLSLLPSSVQPAVITHSAIREVLPALRDGLAADPSRAVAWSDAVAADCSDPDVLSGLLLAYAVSANRDGVVLLGSQRDEHIRSSVRSIADDRFSAAQVDRFAALLEPG
jgi:aryl-alcohol dehydrogenase-like predicted oxidoreductase